MEEEAKKILEQQAIQSKEAAKIAARQAAKTESKEAIFSTIASNPMILVYILGGILVVAGIVWGGFKVGWFKREAITIEKTANVVEEVKKIGEFTTACYYEEMALQDSYTDTAEFLGQNADKLAGKAMKKVGLGFMQKVAEKASEAVTTSKNEIVLIGKGRVRAGFDLSKIGENDINTHGDTLELALPPAEIFDIIMNPSDFTTEYEKGTWSHELLKPIKVQAQDDLEQNAIKYGILQKAEDNGLKRLEALFKTFGFNAVILTVNQPTEETTNEES